MSHTNSNFNLEEHLSRLTTTHSRCLVYFACNWSGHAQMYRNMLDEICRSMKPELKLIHQSLNEPPFDQLKSSFTSKTTIFLVKEGKIEDTIEGILPYNQTIDRIQFFNSS